MIQEDTERRKREDRLWILAEASLDENGTWWGTFSPNFKEFGENFVNFEIFGHKTDPPPRTRSASFRALMIGTSSGGKIDIFGFFMINYACLRMSEIFHQVLGGLKGQKHLENGLSATFCSHRNQSWEIELLEGKMDTKSRNSTWVGKYTGRDFQRAIMSSIWTLGMASKSAPNLCYA